MKRVTELHDLFLLLLLLAVLPCRAERAGAAVAPEGLQTHVSTLYYHFDWECLGRVATADEAVDQVWNYLQAEGIVQADDIKFHLYESQTSADGTEHFFYNQHIDGTTIEASGLIVSARDGKPYFLSGAVVAPQAASADSTTDDSSSRVPRHARNVPIPEAPYVGGESTELEVNTFYYGPRTISCTLRGDSLLLYDQQRHIYGFVAGTEQYFALKDSVEASNSALESWAKVLPLAADSREGAFQSEKYAGCLMATRGLRVRKFSFAPLSKGLTVSCALMSSEGDTLACGTFQNDTLTKGNLICDFGHYVPISSFGMRYKFHIESQDYDDATAPVPSVGTEMFSLGNFNASEVEFTNKSTGKIDRLRLTYVNDMLQCQPYLDAFWGMQRVYDFYEEKFGYSSFDGKGTPVYLYLNGSPSISLAFDPANAGAVPEDGNGKMTFGMGVVSKRMDGTTFGLMPLTSLSCMGHEYTHLVQRGVPTLSLQRDPESKGLNESFADIMGVCAEAYALGLDGPSYRLGDGLYAPSQVDLMAFPDYAALRDCGQLLALRLMDNPHGEAYGRGPATYKTDSLWTDDGDEHALSAVQSRWFYLLAQRVGVEMAMRLCFTELRYYAHSFADYLDICQMSLAAAKYHGIMGMPIGVTDDSNPLYGAVRDCWREVEVLSADSDQPTHLDGIEPSGDAATVSAPRIELRGGRIVILQGSSRYDAFGRRVE